MRSSLNCFQQGQAQPQPRELNTKVKATASSREAWQQQEPWEKHPGELALALPPCLPATPVPGSPDNSRQGLGKHRTREREGFLQLVSTAPPGQLLFFGLMCGLSALPSCILTQPSLGPAPAPKLCPRSETKGVSSACDAKTGGFYMLCKWSAHSRKACFPACRVKSLFKKVNYFVQVTILCSKIHRWGLVPKHPGARTMHPPALGMRWAGSAACPGAAAVQQHGMESLGHTKPCPLPKTRQSSWGCKKMNCTTLLGPLHHLPWGFRAPPFSCTRKQRCEPAPRAAAPRHVLGLEGDIWAGQGPAASPSRAMGDALLLRL